MAVWPEGRDEAMRLTIERSALLKALNHVQSVVERRNTIPILSNVLLAAQGDSLRLTATDLDIEIAEGAPAEVERAGSTTAPANYLYDFVRKLPENCPKARRLNSMSRATIRGCLSRPASRVCICRSCRRGIFPQCRPMDMRPDLRSRRLSSPALSTRLALPYRPRKRAIT